MTVQVLVVSAVRVPKLGRQVGTGIQCDLQVVWGGVEAGIKTINGVMTETELLSLLDVPSGEQHQPRHISAAQPTALTLIQLRKQGERESVSVLVLVSESG